MQIISTKRGASGKGLLSLLLFTYYLLSLSSFHDAAAFQAPLSLTTVTSSKSFRGDCSSSLLRKNYHHGYSSVVLSTPGRRHVATTSTTLLRSSAEENNNNDKEWTTGTNASNINTPTYKKEKEDDNNSKNNKSHSNIFSTAYHLYIDYFDRLWSDTDVDHRQKRARQRAHDAVLRMKHMVNSEGLGVGDEYLWKEASPSSSTTSSSSLSKKKSGGKKKEDIVDEEDKAVFSDLDESVRRKMEEACDLMLVQLNGDTGKVESGDNNVGMIVAQVTAESSTPQPGIPVINEEVELVSPAYSSSTDSDDSLRPSGTELTTALTDVAKTTTPASSSSSVVVQKETKKKKKKGRSVLFGATMGLVVAGWVYSGNIAFTTLFTLMTAVGQLEYYRMVMNAGIYPARRISVLGACATFVTALFAPDLHQIVLPVFSTWAMIWFLTMRRRVTSISEIATTFTGMFYLGYIPSFWVRIRQLGGDLVAPTRLKPLVKPLFERLGQNNLLAYLPKKIHYPITVGSNFIFWTWLCIAFSDVGGYFAGRKFGKTKLGAISPAAGKTSPNKTVEGVIGGCAFSLVLATLGAWIQRWPYWFILGPIHGVTLALLGLVGDLTASMLKRDAGLKDFGDLIPEHGGVMDRVDSYIFTAPYGWIMCGYVIPAFKKLADARAAAALVV
jgi:CDP-diglyceride synthetase